MPFTAVTLTGFFDPQPGHTAVGELTFQLSQPMVDGSSVRADSVPINVTLDGTGRMSVELWATDDETTQPQGVVWVMRGRVDGVQIPAFRFNLPRGGAGGYDTARFDQSAYDDDTSAVTVDLAQLTPVVAGPPSFTYVTSSQLSAALVAFLGVDVVNTAAAGDVLVAISGSAAEWRAPTYDDTPGGFDAARYDEGTFT